MTDMIPAVNVLLDDLEALHDLLLSVQTFLEAQDMAKSQLNYLEGVSYSPLTQDVQIKLRRVKGLIDDEIVRRHHAAKNAPAPVLPVVEEQIPDLVQVEEGEDYPLASAPFGSFSVAPAPKMVQEDAERL